MSIGLLFSTRSYVIQALRSVDYRIFFFEIWAAPTTDYDRTSAFLRGNFIYTKNSEIRKSAKIWSRGSGRWTPDTRENPANRRWTTPPAFPPLKKWSPRGTILSDLNLEPWFFDVKIFAIFGGRYSPWGEKLWGRPGSTTKKKVVFFWNEGRSCRKKPVLQEENASRPNVFWNGGDLEMKWGRLNYIYNVSSF